MRELRAAVIMLGASAALTAQQVVPAPSPRFEVVSVKRNLSGDSNSSTRPRPGGGLTVTNNTLRGMVRNFHVREDFQIVGGPAWVGTDRFDIVATGGGEEAPFEIMLARARNMLADRFGLVTHTEVRELPVYELVLARRDGRLGPQMRTSAIDCRPTTTAAPRPAGVRPPGLPAAEQPICGLRRRSGFVGVGGADLVEFTRGLSGIVERTVVDKTGLSGTFDLALMWDPDFAGGQGVSVFSAIQEQLGLKLEARRGPVDVLVIDRAEPPTEN